MILITGATGTNGVEIVKLLSHLSVPCRALVRTPEKAGRLSGLPNVEIVQGDFAHPETLEPALEGVDKALLISSIAPTCPNYRGTSFGRPHARAFPT